MNQLDMMTTLVDAARQLPENGTLSKAITQADARIEVLRKRYQKRGYGAWKQEKETPFTLPPKCPVCGARTEFEGLGFRCPACLSTMRWANPRQAGQSDPPRHIVCCKKMI